MNMTRACLSGFGSSMPTTCTRRVASARRHKRFFLTTRNLSQNSSQTKLTGDRRVELPWHAEKVLSAASPALRVRADAQRSVRITHALRFVNVWLESQKPGLRLLYPRHTIKYRVQ